jgi:hypothetical protein
MVDGIDDGSSDDNLMGGILIDHCVSFRLAQRQPSTASSA